MSGVATILAPYWFQVRSGSDPETSIANRGIIQGQPQSQTGLAGRGVQEGGILMRMDGATRTGLFKNIHALGHDGVLPPQFVLDELS
eukprot:scaffold482_cov266-Amphora_coffeaeformis.AAC.25